MSKSFHFQNITLKNLQQCLLQQTSFISYPRIITWLLKYALWCEGIPFFTIKVQIVSRIARIFRMGCIEFFLSSIYCRQKIEQPSFQYIKTILFQKLSPLPKFFSKNILFDLIFPIYKMLT